MERREFTNDRNVRLVADYFPATSAPVVVMANDIMTHRRWRDRYPAIGRHLSERGMAALAFDYAGCGESGDAVLAPHTMIRDLHAAVAYARSLGHERVALWGHGLASCICLQAGIPGIRAIVLSGAGTTPIEYDWATELGTENYARLGAEGQVTVPSYDPAIRAKTTLGASFVDNLASIDQLELLGALPCPVFLINGTEEANLKERERLEGNRRGAHLLPPGSGIAVIEGAGHSFAGFVDRLARTGADWLETSLR